MKYETEIIIYRNCNTVFEYLTDPKKLKTWIKQTDQMAERMVIEIHSNRKFAYLRSSESLKTTASFELHPCEKETATRIVLVEEITPLGFWAELKSKLFLSSNIDKKASALIRLKAFLDAGGDKS